MSHLSLPLTHVIFEEIFFLNGPRSNPCISFIDHYNKSLALIDPFKERKTCSDPIFIEKNARLKSRVIHNRALV